MLHTVSELAMRRCLCLRGFRPQVAVSALDIDLRSCGVRFCASKPPGIHLTQRTSEGPVSDDPRRGAVRNNIEELVKNLSEEDQRLILSALQDPEAQPSSKMGGPGIGTKTGDMVAAFTCGQCEHRMVKRFSKHAYTKGIVIVQCPSCEVRHLLADNLGWFVDGAKNVEEMLREKGDSFIRVGNDYQVEPTSVGTERDGNNN
ncbi:hypothetical protein, conserved [Trypanosoma brucei gambiense DAL972]|uniref:DNL-type domain-containing protein n=1 Tax=Trypanosoma brucei gambiense (strain MHOM/CI/86/DAL972) TaxID=679716 RepID=C9ZKC6_TRYB9|nr:hypothetical protein, conserved [Trypanosoma brucei gambiense DAL972]CBH09890.1 hypothetical protein, conserved [Trypanosoma brucei gambiense DAL972]|eukprot:XP_011772183.1 hypothetical protein, conserved [Trypanosoma brucei gambiense DAL972]